MNVIYSSILFNNRASNVWIDYTIPTSFSRWILSLEFVVVFGVILFFVVSIVVVVLVVVYDSLIRMVRPVAVNYNNIKQ